MELVEQVIVAVGMDADDLECTGESKAFLYLLPADVCKDDAVCIPLATLKKITPRNCHIGSTHHWFHHHVQNETVKVKKLDADKQITNAPTKNLQIPSSFQFKIFCVVGICYM